MGGRSRRFSFSRRANLQPCTSLHSHSPARDAQRSRSCSGSRRAACTGGRSSSLRRCRILCRERRSAPWQGCPENLRDLCREAHWESKWKGKSGTPLPVRSPRGGPLLHCFRPLRSTEAREAVAVAVAVAVSAKGAEKKESGLFSLKRLKKGRFIRGLEHKRKWRHD